MGDFKINEKTVFTQSGGGEPAMGSTITGIPAAGVTGVLPVGVTGGAGVGILQKVHTITASSDATVVFSSTYITSTYKRYTLEAFDIQCAADNQPFFIHVSTDNGSSYVTGANTRINIANASNEASNEMASRNGADESGVQLNAYNFGTNTGSVGAYTFEFINFSDTGHYKLMYYNGAIYNNGGTGGMNAGAAVFGTTSAINAIKFVFASGNILAGTFILYGKV